MSKGVILTVPPDRGGSANGPGATISLSSGRPQKSEATPGTRGKAGSSTRPLHFSVKVAGINSI